MNTIDIDELKRQLAGGHDDPTRPDLATIRRQGGRRRRLRTAAITATAVAAVAVVGVGAVVGSGLGPDDEPLVANAPDPSEPATMSDLARRALAEIPGARRLSASDVLIPAPDAEPLAPDAVADVVGTPVELPEHGYSGVTIYRESAFPDWLYDGTLEAETAAGDGNSQPVGSVDITGVLVDQGPSYLGCVGPAAEQCTPAYLLRDGDDWVLQWTMGTERFLRDGAPMEVFTLDGHENGRGTTVGIAGIDGTDVARAEFVAEDGTVVDGTVLSGSVVPGESMFFGEVPGALARVIAYDADGNVIEDHELRDCNTPVECEVR